MTKLINGGFNGLYQRQELFARAISNLKCGRPSSCTVCEGNGPCRKSAGTCIDVGFSECKGADMRRGECPGSSSILCCLSDAGGSAVTIFATWWDSSTRFAFSKFCWHACVRKSSTDSCCGDTCPVVCQKCRSSCSEQEWPSTSPGLCCGEWGSKSCPKICRRELTVKRAQRAPRSSQAKLEENASIMSMVSVACLQTAPHHC